MHVCIQYGTPPHAPCALSPKVWTGHSLCTVLLCTCPPHAECAPPERAPPPGCRAAGRPGPCGLSPPTPARGQLQGWQSVSDAPRRCSPHSAWVWCALYARLHAAAAIAGLYCLLAVCSPASEASTVCLQHCARGAPTFSARNAGLDTLLLALPPARCSATCCSQRSSTLCCFSMSASGVMGTSCTQDVQLHAIWATHAHQDTAAFAAAATAQSQQRLRRTDVAEQVPQGHDLWQRGGR